VSSRSEVSDGGRAATVTETGTELFMGWIDPWVGLCWVSQLMGWVGSGHTEWTDGQL